MSFAKYRDEREVYEVGFAPRLTTGETITTGEVTLLLAQDGQWVDVTSDVLNGSGTTGSKARKRR